MKAISDIIEEYDRATESFPPFTSAHEGYPAAMRKEAIQVAAMALRFVVDVCDK